MMCLLPVAWNVNTSILAGLYFYRNVNVVCPVPTLSSVVALSECLQYLVSKVFGCSTMRFFTFLIRLSTHTVDYNYVQLDDYGSAGMRH
jgi:hypothetical protein